MRDARSMSDLLDEYVAVHQLTVNTTFDRLRGPLAEVAVILIDALRNGRKVLAFGNGGSAAEASHFAAELIGRFSKTPRRPLPAIALSSDPGVVTCIGNDFGYEALFERQIEALAQPGDVAFAFTTSGNSENVLRGLAMASRKGAITVAMTGAAGLGGVTEKHLLDVQSNSTSFIQEVHLMLVHVLWVCVDKAFIENPNEEREE
jgi:D-sedoheptulose 7-phosphate isomerase